LKGGDFQEIKKIKNGAGMDYPILHMKLKKRSLISFMSTFPAKLIIWLQSVKSTIEANRYAGIAVFGTFYYKH
jgi:hypothetical protein